MKYGKEITKFQQGVIDADVGKAGQMSKSLSGGDEYYTLREVADVCTNEYQEIFNKYDIVYMPFSKPDAEIVKSMRLVEGRKYKILLTHNDFFNDKIGCNDFFLQVDDDSFKELIKKKKVIVYDNPPFSKFSKIRDKIAELELDYILFGDCLTGLVKLKKSTTTGYHIINRLLFKYTDEPDIYRAVNVGLFSNLFNEIKCVFFDSDKPRLHNKKIGWNKKVNLTILRDLCNNSYIPSSKIINYAQRGLIFNTEHIFKLWNEKGKKELAGVFGSACYYNFKKLAFDNKQIFIDYLKDNLVIEENETKNNCVRNVGNNHNIVGLVDNSLGGAPALLNTFDKQVDCLPKKQKKVVWALFDSGNGCYKKALESDDRFEVFSIGLDIENKNDHFLSVNLADYSHIFGGEGVIDKLKKLPKPDIIIASPPCETWSNGTAIKDGNKHFNYKSGFRLRSKTEVESRNHTSFKSYFDKSIFTRINGELCINNTIQIIKHFQPKYWVIENPMSGSVWRYIEEIIEFKIPFKNKAHYSAYDDSFSKKPTIFASNIELDLKTTTEKAKVLLINKSGDLDNRKGISGYNKRSNIPLKLINDIFNKLANK